MPTIELTKGQVAIVDDEDLALAMQWKWKAVKRNGGWYAARTVDLAGDDGKKRGTTTVYLHRFLTQAEPGVQVDHRDGNGLNNSRRNLRIANQSQNKSNSPKRPGMTSKYKGVCRVAGRSRWRAGITRNGVTMHLGTFDDEADAARAYDKKAVELSGEFASINFPDEGAVQHDGRRA